MTDVESHLRARLGAVAEDLTGPDDTVSAPAAIARYRQRRRTRVVLTAATAAVAAVVVAVPAAVGGPARGSGEVAGADRTPAPTPTSTPDREAELAAREAAARAAAASRSAQWAAEAAAAQAAAQPELDAVVSELGGPVTLGSPAEWDRWLPDGRPYPGDDLEDDLSTCPVLSARLGEVTGREMSYWAGTLPNGPAGCTWVPVPLVYDTVDHDTVVSVGFLADGTTVEEYARDARQGPGQGVAPCPRADVPSAPGGALLLRCESSGTTSYTLVVPDTRLEGGVWFLVVSTDERATAPAADVLPALVEGATAAFG
ncbi:hypothetical protein ACI8AK_18255 [Geodermatophilus sp. SYSU D00867]